MNKYLSVFGRIALYTLVIGVLSWLVVDILREWALPPSLVDTLLG